MNECCFAGAGSIGYLSLHAILPTLCFPLRIFYAAAPAVLFVSVSAALSSSGAGPTEVEWMPSYSFLSHVQVCASASPPPCPNPKLALKLG